MGTEALLVILERVLLVFAGGAIVTALYFSVHTFLYLTGRRFGLVHINIVYFTRNDHARKIKRQPRDTMNMRTQRYEVRLKEVLNNRFLFWKVVWMSLWIEIDMPVFDFGSNENRVKAILSPLVGRLSEIYAKEEGKRASGKQGFVETKYKVCLVKDFADDTRIRILRTVAIREEDLDDFQQYLDKPPYNTKNWRLVTKIAAMYREKKGSFVDAMLTT